MDLPDYVQACPATLVLIVRAKVTRELPRESFFDAWEALENPDAYEPSEAVREWLQANWLDLIGDDAGDAATPDYPVLPALPRAWMPAFLDTFVSTGGNATKAAEAAGVHERTPYKARETSKPFAEAWEWAERKVADAIRGEMYRRAVEGWEEPVYGSVGNYMDGLIGTVRKFDSSLLAKMATARCPEHRSLVKEGAAQVSANASASSSAAVVVVVPPERLKSLQERTRAQLEKRSAKALKAAGGTN